jgi:hypothetical protein
MGQRCKKAEKEKGINRQDPTTCPEQVPLGWPVLVRIASCFWKCNGHAAFTLVVVHLP